MVNLWHSREEASRKLTEECPEVLTALHALFDLLDECGESLFTIDTAFGKLCALTVAKSRNLGLGCYSLALDSLAQESGALFRPLVETLELLKYFRLCPERVDEAIERGLPKAGKVAKHIGSEHKGLRGYLSEFSSHLSLDSPAIRHLLDFNSQPFVKLRMHQPFRLPVTLFNLQVLYCFLVLLGFEVILCMQAAGSAKHLSFLKKLEYARSDGLALFEGAIHKANGHSLKPAVNGKP